MVCVQLKTIRNIVWFKKNCLATFAAYIMKYKKNKNKWFPYASSADCLSEPHRDKSHKSNNMNLFANILLTQWNWIFVWCARKKKIVLSCEILMFMISFVMSSWLCKAHYSIHSTVSVLYLKLVKWKCLKFQESQVKCVFFSYFRLVLFNDIAMQWHR